MAVSRSLKRLLGVLKLEEEQYEAALGEALGEVHRLERSDDEAEQRQRLGRRWISTGAAQGEALDLLAGLEETRAGERIQQFLLPLIETARENAEQCRAAFLAKRIERRQAETLLEQAESQEKIENLRRTQNSLDEWYLSKPSSKAARHEGMPAHPRPKQKKLES